MGFMVSKLKHLYIYYWGYLVKTRLGVHDYYFFLYYNYIIVELPRFEYLLTGCLVSRLNKIEWVWPHVVVEAWAPHEGPQNTPILQFEIAFFNHSSNDIIQVYHNITKATIQKSDESLVYKEEPMEHMEPGWIRVMLSIFNNVVLNITSGRSPLISYTRQFPVKEVIINGSNVTVNCQNGKQDIMYLNVIHFIC